MGTRLQAMGLESGVPSEKWNLNQPEKILKVHKEYIEAGAELIETNTFGGNYLRLTEYKLVNKMEEINTRGVELAKKAAHNGIYVAGSVGPSGKLMKPHGTLTRNEVFNSYKKQMSILVNRGVDAILIETITDINEMEEAVKAAKEFSYPVTGIGLLWRKGYSKQVINEAGRPEDQHPVNNEIYEHAEDTGETVSVTIRDQEVTLKIWKLDKFDNATLYLLDANLPENRKYQTTKNARSGAFFIVSNFLSDK
jgi:hypothetical protein